MNAVISVYAVLFTANYADFYGEWVCFLLL